MWKKVIIFALLLVVFIANSFHESYPDEFDSIVGGKYIVEGKIPYRDWFQHHQPGAYVLAAILLPFSSGSFVKMRVLTQIAYFFLILCTYILIRKKIPSFNTNYYLFFAFVLAVSGTYYWGHMLLADTLAAYLFIPAYILLLLKDFYNHKFDKSDLAVVSIFSFLMWFTSMTYIFVVFGLIGYALYLYWKHHKKEFIKDAFIVVGLPYILYFSFLVVTGSLKDWYFANITYNQEYYIFNYPRTPGSHFNPIRYAIIIADSFFNNYFPALWGVFQFPIGDPIQVTLAASNAIFFIVLLITGRTSFLLPFLLILIYSCGRANPQHIKETDYWASVYIVLSFINGIISLSALTDFINNEKTKVSTRTIAIALLIVSWVYWFFAPVSLALKMENKFFPKYMGTAPLIYDRPQVAHYVNKLVEPNEYAWIGPFDFEELFYLHARVPTKYHWFLDPAAKSKIKDEIITDLNETMPKVIVFRRNYTPWGGEARSFNYFVQNFLDEHYFRLFTLNQTLTDKQYKWKIGNTKNFDIDGDFNFLKQYQNEMLDKLLSLGFIEVVVK